MDVKLFTLTWMEGKQCKWFARKNTISAVNFTDLRDVTPYSLVRTNCKASHPRRW